MSTLVTILHVLVCLFLMLTVLLQSGKGGGMGAAFGGGGSQTVFGGTGAGNFLRKITVACAATFMLTSMLLAYIASNSGADALKRYSAQQRQAAELKAQARQDALGEAAENGPTDGVTDVTLDGAGAAESEGSEPSDEAGAAPGAEAAEPSDSAPEAEAAAQEAAPDTAPPAAAQGSPSADTAPPAGDQ